IMEEFQFTGDTPALYYAQAAWEYKHNNAEKAQDWTNSANKIYSPALNSVFADAFYDVGWMQRPEGSSAPALAFDTANVVAPQTEGGPAVEPSPIPGAVLALAPATLKFTNPYTTDSRRMTVLSEEALKAIAKNDYASAVRILQTWKDP